MDVVVLIRHPAAFAASLKRLGWKHSFATFIQDGRVPEVVRPVRGRDPRAGRAAGRDPGAGGAALAAALQRGRRLPRAAPRLGVRAARGRLARPGRHLRAALRAARSRADGGGARRDRALERTRTTRRSCRRRTRSRWPARPAWVAGASDLTARGGRDAARADARRLAALLLGRGLVAEALERVGGALVQRRSQLGVGLAPAAERRRAPAPRRRRSARRRPRARRSAAPRPRAPPARRRGPRSGAAGSGRRARARRSRPPAG